MFVAPFPPLPQGYAESYILVDAHNDGSRTVSGVYHRVAARCTSGDYCPGGQYFNTQRAFSDNDPTLCTGVPIYQQHGSTGLVLSLQEVNGGGTAWFVGAASAVTTCDNSRQLAKNSR